jgi:transcriptional regulator with XRE-family HTH domain
MTQQQITYYERRARSPSIDVVQRAANALGVPVDALLPSAKPSEGRKRTGRPSEFEQRWDRMRALPRAAQKDIIEMIDVALERAERRAHDTHP